MTVSRDFATSRSSSTSRRLRPRTSRQRKRRHQHVPKTIAHLGVAFGLLTAPTYVWAFANATMARRALGRREKDIQGKPIRETLPEPENPDFYQMLDEVNRTGIGFRGREVKLFTWPRPNAKPVEASWTFSCLPMQSETGKIGGLRLYGWEATAQRRMGGTESRPLRLEFERRAKEHAAELEAANAQVRILSERLQKARDEEGTRIARELHDSTGQLLAALSLNLCQARESSSNPATIEKLGEGLRLVDEMSDQLHSISRSLRPPLLEQTSLEGAIAWLVQTFPARSGIKVTADVEIDLGGLTPEQEVAIFRIVQESLTNIQRHSQSPTATVRIARLPGEIRVEVRDKGIGFQGAARRSPRGAPGSGLGIAGMRERLRHLGGRLKIESSASGTAVLASLPLARAVTSLAAGARAQTA
jgi:signal transduction histidine kinase